MKFYDTVKRSYNYENGALILATVKDRNFEQTYIMTSNESTVYFILQKKYDRKQLLKCKPYKIKSTEKQTPPLHYINPTIHISTSILKKKKKKTSYTPQLSS